MSILYSLVGPPLSGMWEHYFDESVMGLEHVPDSGPLLVATNHISHLDPLMVCQVFWKNRPRRQLNYLAKEELFARRPAAWFLRQVGQIPVARGSASARDSLKYAREALDEGRTVVIFPEGTISVLFVPMKAHSGVGRLALETGVGVLPIGLWGTHRTMTKYRPRDRKAHRPVTVDIGPVLRYSAGDGSATEVAAEIMHAISTLVESARDRYPEKPGPDDWWGPPEWDPEKAGRWRPKLDKSMGDEEALAEARRALAQA